MTSTFEAKEIISQLDSSGEEKINYTAFVAALINPKDLVSPERLRALFFAFDVDHDGFISKRDLRRAFTKFGQYISEEDIDKVMAKHGEFGTINRK